MIEWIGNKENGIRFEKCPDGTLDELVLYINGKCVMHLEAMSDVCYWIGIYGLEDEVMLNIFSKNLKSHVEAKIQV